VPHNIGGAAEIGIGLFIATPRAAIHR